MREGDVTGLVGAGENVVKTQSPVLKTPSGERRGIQAESEQNARQDEKNPFHIR